MLAPTLLRVKNALVKQPPLHHRLPLLILTRRNVLASMLAQVVQEQHTRSLQELTRRRNLIHPLMNLADQPYRVSGQSLRMNIPFLVHSLLARTSSRSLASPRPTFVPMQLPMSGISFVVLHLRIPYRCRRLSHAQKPIPPGKSLVTWAVNCASRLSILLSIQQLIFITRDWTTWANVDGQSKTIRKHMEKEHGDLWRTSVWNLKLKGWQTVLRPEDIAQDPPSEQEKFSIKGFYKRLIRWIAVDDQVKDLSCRCFLFANAVFSLSMLSIRPNFATSYYFSDRNI